MSLNFESPHNIDIILKLLCVCNESSEVWWQWHVQIMFAAEHVLYETACVCVITSKF